MCLIHKGFSLFFYSNELKMGIRHHAVETNKIKLTSQLQETRSHIMLQIYY